MIYLHLIDFPKLYAWEMRQYTSLLSGLRIFFCIWPFGKKVWTLKFSSSTKLFAVEDIQTHFWNENRAFLSIDLVYLCFCVSFSSRCTSYKNLSLPGKCKQKNKKKTRKIKNERNQKLKLQINILTYLFWLNELGVLNNQSLRHFYF